MATTYMDYGKMKQIAGGFKDVGNVFKQINRVLEAAMMTLRMTAFIGMVGGAAVERYLSIIQPRVEELSVKMEELSEKLETAIQTTQAGEQAGNSL